MSERKATVFIAGDALGQGDEELGRLLMRGAVKTLAGREVAPARILLMNAGVKLACEGSDLIESFEAMAEQGTEILCCGTCLDFFGLKEALKVGCGSNMKEILQAQHEAEHLVRL